MTWYVYELGPIDFGWEHLASVEETAARIGGDEARASVAPHTVDISGPTVAEFLASWSSAQVAARDRGWEGDFRNDPVVFWVPAVEVEFTYGFVLKQDNNGMTYVVSPVPLPHLDQE